MSKSDIIIKQLDGGGFDVHYNGKSTGLLCFDEMLGTIAQLTVPENKRCLSWFKTDEEHETWRKKYNPVDADLGTIKLLECKHESGN
jgi:hypothetical protein